MTAGQSLLLQALQPYKLKRAGHNKWKFFSPLREERNASGSLEFRGDNVLLYDQGHGEGSGDAVLAKLGLTWPEVLSPRTGGQGVGVLKPKRTIYGYANPDDGDKVQHETVRDDLPNGGKEIRQRRPDGKGGYVWNLDGVQLLLYRLPELRAADPAEPVFAVAGEKCVEIMRSHGFVATTNPLGEGPQKWDRVGELARQELRGRAVIVFGDNDQPGREHAAHVAQSLHDVVKSIKVLDVIDLPPKGDCEQYFSAGHTAEELRELAANTKEWSPQASAATTETPSEGPKITLQLASDMVHDLFSKPLPPPIVTPFPQLNDLQGGGLRGVNILAAVTGRFKTGWALGQVRYTARTRPVIYLSTEVDSRQALARVAAQELGRAWRPLYEDPTAEATVAGAIEGLRLYVMTIASVAQLLDVFSSIPFYEKDPPLVVLDYLQGLSRAAEDRRLAVGCVSEAITAWTRTTGGVVLAVSSISRANYFGTDEKSATDFVNAAKESGDVEYDAASVMFLDVPAPPLGGTSEGRLHVAKARFGSPGTIGLFVDGPSGTFQADPAGGLTADQREVLEAVQAGARSGNEIAKDAGLRRSKVDPCLRALRARNLIDASNNPLDAASHLPRQNGQNAAPLPGNTSEVFPGAETVGASPSEKTFPGTGKQAVSSRTVSAPHRGGTGNTGNLLSLPFRGNGKPDPDHEDLP